MEEVMKDKDSEEVNYFSSLLEKSNGVKSKAEKYVALKNVEISERLENGEEIISIKQSSIKIIKTNTDNDESRIKESASENQKVEKKKIIIDDNENPIEEEEEKKDSKKEITPEERLKFVKEKIRENKLIAKRKEEMLLKEKEEELKEKKRQEEELLKKEEEERSKRMEKTRQKIEIIEKRKEQRILENKKTNEILKEKSKEKILAEKIHEKFLSNQNIMLDEKKKKLAEIRQLHKPMDREEIEEHIKKFEESKLERSRKKELERSQINTSSSEKNQYYRSVFHEILEKEKKQKQDEEIEQNYRLRELKERGKKYAEEVKTQFRPEIDEKKREEVEKRIKSSSLISPNPMDNRLKGREYLQFVKEYVSKFKKETPDPQIEKLLSREEDNKTQQTDYLALSRKNNAESRLKRSATSAIDFIKKIEKKNLTKEEKQEKIIEFAEGLEKKARYKEKLLNSVNPYQTDEEVDKLYISAIEAKLKALEK